MVGKATSHTNTWPLHLARSHAIAAGQRKCIEPALGARTELAITCCMVGNSIFKYNQLEIMNRLEGPTINIMQPTSSLCSVETLE